MPIEDRPARAARPDVPDEPTHLVTLWPAGVQLRVRDDETIVDALRRQGLRTRYKCRRGGCGACRATIVTGELCYPTAVCQDVVDGAAVTPGREDSAKCLPCRAVPRSDVHLLLDPTDEVIDMFGTVLPRSAGPTPAEGAAHGPHEGSSPCPS
jgi:ferredoxin